MAPNYNTEVIKYNGVDISVRRSCCIQNLPKSNYRTTRKKRLKITKHFCEQYNYFFNKKKNCRKKRRIDLFYCEKCDDFSVQKKCDKCRNLLMEPKDFDEMLSETSPKSSYGSDQIYYESDAKDFIIRNRYSY